MTATARGSSHRTLKRLGILSTVLDAAVAFARGRTRSGLLLLAAAALSDRLPGLGVVVSLVLRLSRWLRRR